MGVNGNGERATICLEGCAITCVAMSLAGLNLTINDSVSNPGTLNTWLIDNDGYQCMDGDCNNLKIPMIDNLTQGVYEVNDNNGNAWTMKDIRRGLDAQDMVFIAHNPSLEHFVLATNASWEDDIFSVLDPYFDATTYELSETDGFIAYNIMGKARPYPYYAQCDATWGSNAMGQNGETICQV